MVAQVFVTEHLHVDSSSTPPSYWVTPSTENQPDTMAMALRLYLSQKQGKGTQPKRIGFACASFPLLPINCSCISGVAGLLQGLLSSIRSGKPNAAVKLKANEKRHWWLARIRLLDDSSQAPAASRVVALCCISVSRDVWHSPSLSLVDGPIHICRQLAVDVMPLLHL